jgi:hypothetical protein
MELKLSTAVDADKCCEPQIVNGADRAAAAEELWAGLDKR